MQEFLEALTELTRRTGVVVSGCYCCGSPRLAFDDWGDVDVPKSSDARGRDGHCVVERQERFEPPETFPFQYLKWRPPVTIHDNDQQPAVEDAPWVLTDPDQQT